MEKKDADILVVDLVDVIETMLDNRPDKRKKQEFKDWLILINQKISIVNEVAKFKLYSLIK